MTPHDLIAAFEAVADSPEGVARLRELVLELAVRGRLVPQDPKDEPAGALLEKIAAARVRRGKELANRCSQSTDALAPSHDLPASWTWCGLAQIAHDLGQRVPDRRFTYIDVGSIDNKRGRISDEATIIEAKDAPSRARKVVSPGTVIYSTVRPYLLNIAVIDREFDPQPIASTAFAVLHPDVGVSATFIFYVLRSPSFNAYVATEAKGVAYPAINDRALSKAPFPLPPTSEQHRIVARVNQLMGLLDRLEAAHNASHGTRAAARDAALAALREAADPDQIETGWTRVSERLNDLCLVPEDVPPLRQAVLELAVRGRLAHQDPQDKPASLVMARVRNERRRRAPPHKPYVEPLPRATVKPFDCLPPGWELATVELLTDPVRTVSYGIVLPGDEVVGGVPYVKVRDIRLHECDILTNEVKHTSLAIHRKYLRSELRAGDILVSIRGTVGKVAMVPPTLAGGNITQDTARIAIIEPIRVDYIMLAMRSPSVQGYWKSFSRGAAVQGLNISDLRPTPIPIPPLEEQHRIVARVAELMALLDRVEECLRNSQTTQKAFAAAAVHNLDD